MLLLEVKSLFCSLRLDSVSRLRSGKKPVLNGVSFTLDAGTSLALLGESGSGKSTLAKCIAGLLRPDSGVITFDGVNIFPETKNRDAVGVGIQMLFQGGSASLDPTMTVMESLVEGIRAHPERQPAASYAATAERLITSVGMPAGCLGRLPHALSGGQRQRVALARVLSVAPRLLILDEPTSALDVLTSAQLLQLVKSLQETHGCSILFITHDEHTAHTFCDRVTTLHNGVLSVDVPGPMQRADS